MPARLHAVRRRVQDAAGVHAQGAPPSPAWPGPACRLPPGHDTARPPSASAAAGGGAEAARVQLHRRALPCHGLADRGAGRGDGRQGGRLQLVAVEGRGGGGRADARRRPVGRCRRPCGGRPQKLRTPAGGPPRAASRSLAAGPAGALRAPRRRGAPPLHCSPPPSRWRRCTTQGEGNRPSKAAIYLGWEQAYEQIRAAVKDNGADALLGFSQVGWGGAPGPSLQSPTCPLPCPPPHLPPPSPPPPAGRHGHRHVHRAAQPAAPAAAGPGRADATAGGHDLRLPAQAPRVRAAAPPGRPCCPCTLHPAPWRA
jgi:hypothetical protein